jgi:1-acyl-sn-glycerol-3-phosphate acyltransferase
VQLNFSSVPADIPSVTETEKIASSVSPWLAKLAYPLAKYLVLPSYFGKIEIVGAENLPKTGPVIIAPTHRARWDSIIVPHAVGYGVTKRHPRFMTSANEMMGLQGWFVKRLGGFPVDTEQPGIGSFRHAVEILVEGQMLVIFPEGNIFRDNRLQNLKPGLARIACHAQAKTAVSGAEGVKIVPVSLRYSQPFPKWRSKIKVHIGTPIAVADFDVKKSIKAATQKLTGTLSESLQALDRVNPPL